MAKNSGTFKLHPGELERLTALIEQKANEIAHVLLWDVSDAEQTAEEAKRPAVSRKNRAKGRSIASVKPKKKRDLNRIQRINAAKRATTWR